ncbi:hypothetical protein [Candidatus Arsenophonus triatominarum]|uniref:hypothetical protein n=1 Tax=Candidatus Arsenophonus triatominarum TaxID=57911 RepID=UPI0013969D68|nr:hypothetical protein [Candidatus Arsenophonus triatominarum]
MKKRLEIGERIITNLIMLFIMRPTFLKKELAETARQNTKIRKRKIIKTTADGETTTIEEVLPSHNDIAVTKKMGSMKSSLTMKSINKKNT